MTQYSDRIRVLGRQKQPNRPIWSADYLTLQSLMAALPQLFSRAQGHLLDIGCGHRPYQTQLPAAVTKYIGLDYEITDASPHVQGDALHLPFPANSFDTIFSAETLEHLANPFQAFQEMARVLRPGGQLLLVAPQSWREHEQPYDFFRFTRFGLEHLCHQAGLRPVTTGAVGRAWAHVGQSFLTILLQTKLARIVAPLALLINIGCVVLDTIWYDEGEVINRLLIAEKP